MTKRKRVALIGTALFIPWLLTGGCVGFESRYRYVDSYNRNYRPLLRVEVASNYRTRGIPYLFTFTKDEPPFDADFIYYTQDIVEGAKLAIDRIVVGYADGSEIDLTQEVCSPIAAVPFEMWYIENHVLEKKQCLRAKWTLRNCITRDQPFDLLISGSLRKGNRVLEAFNMSLSCAPFGETHFFSAWQWWVVSNA
jgi:Fe-S cluster assembly iron-binding protein IscA